MFRQVVCRTRVCLLLAVIAGVPAGLGCTVTGSLEPGDGGGAEPDTVVVVFRNLSLTDAVEVNFYAASEALTTLPSDLFVAENLITDDVGVAGTGIVQPGQFDFLRDFPCGDSLVLGTSGGRFLDNDTGDEQGTGQRRWIEASALGICGAVVTFTFSKDGDTFATDVSIAR